VLVPSVLVLAGCGGDDSTSSNVAVAEAAAGSDVVDVSLLTLIDVRDISEFDAGHLPNAENIPFNDGTLEATIPSLDPTVAYGVYCRSGSRSGQAVELMKAAGFTNVTDLGGLEEAVVATGLQLVTD
jgi:rhodanese-related sulfurtransferase